MQELLTLLPLKNLLWTRHIWTRDELSVPQNLAFSSKLLMSPRQRESTTYPLQPKKSLEFTFPTRILLRGEVPSVWGLVGMTLRLKPLKVEGMSTWKGQIKDQRYYPWIICIHSSSTRSLDQWRILPPATINGQDACHRMQSLQPP